MALTCTERAITLGWELSDVYNDLFSSGINTLTNWEVGTDFGNGYGGIIQSTDGKREALIILEDAGTSYNLHGYSQWGSSTPQNLINAVFSSLIYNRADRSSINLALNMFNGTSGTQKSIVMFNPSTLSGAFENGETITIATTGGDTTGTLVHWDYVGGLMVLEDVTRSGGLPAVGSSWSTKAITGEDSGATANTATSNYMPTTGAHCLPPDHAYISISTGSAPTAGQTLTGGTTGASVIAGTGTPYDTTSGKLTLATVKGNFLRGETVSWDGGTGVVDKMVPVWDIGLSSLYSTLSKTTAVDDSSPILLFEDTDRLCILIPQTATTYIMILFGAWIADLYGGTQELVLYQSVTTSTHVFARSGSYQTYGIAFPMNGELYSCINTSIPNAYDQFRVGGTLTPGYGYLTTDPYLGSYVGALEQAGSSWLAATPVTLRNYGSWTCTGIDLDSQILLGICRGLAYLNTSDSFKTIASDAGGNRRWLKIDNRMSIEFTNGSITP